MRILLAEDDALLGDGLRAGLRQQGFLVDWVRDGVAAERELTAGDYQAAVLDLGLPLKDGLDVLQALRTRKITTPVLVLTARDAVPDRIRGLDLGADDYVVKPCDTGELHARIRAVQRRRAPQQGDEVLQVNGLRLDPLTLGVTAQTETGPRAIPLSPLEFRLLHFLVAHPQRVHSRTQLLDRVWGNHVFVGERTVDVHVRKLRVALAGTPCDGLIQTVRGGGYRLMVGTGAALKAQPAEAIGAQLEAAARKPELPAYGRVPTRSLSLNEPVRLTA